MDDRDQVRREISGLENWLAQALPADDSLSTENLRLRVHVELAEQWLRIQWNPAHSDPVNAPLRETIHCAIAESSACTAIHSERSWKLRHWILPAGLGVAALLGFVASIFQGGQTNESDSDFHLAAFEESAEQDELDVEFEDVMAELDDLLASTFESEWEDALDGF